jgi:hypothetical protein
MEHDQSIRGRCPISLGGLPPADLILKGSIGSSTPCNFLDCCSCATRAFRPILRFQELQDRVTRCICEQVTKWQRNKGKRKGEGGGKTEKPSQIPMHRGEGWVGLFSTRPGYRIWMDTDSAFALFASSWFAGPNKRSWPRASALPLHFDLLSLPYSSLPTTSFPRCAGPVFARLVRRSL